MTTIPEAAYEPRLIDRYLDELFASLPALMIVGPRATGKTTTAARKVATQVRLNVEAEAGAFEADPDAALRGLAEPVLLDEWQAVPSSLGAIARAVDADPHSGRFLVTGSVRAELDNEVWPVTGRLVRVALLPMTVRELSGKAGGRAFFDRVVAGEEFSPPHDAPDLRGYVELALRGGYPVPALHIDGERARRAWYESYVEELLTRDIDQIDEPRTRRRDSVRLRRFFEAYALNSAGICDHKTIYDAARIRRETGSVYEQLLTDLFVVESLPAWQTNRLGRLVHQPKRFIVDPALLAAVLRLDVNGILRDANLLGRVVETFVAAQLRPEAVVAECRPRLYHLRTRGGRQEVDLLAELGGDRVIGFEVKAAAAPGSRDTASLAWLRDELGERFVAGFVCHTGPRVFSLGDRLVALPIASLWA